MFSRALVLFTFVAATIAAPTTFSKRQLVGGKLIEVVNGGIPGNATLGDLSQNDCNIDIKPGDLAFLVARKFIRGAAPGSTAAENGLCGRLDATIFVVDNDATILATTKSWLGPVGFCEECDAGSVIVNDAAFAEIGGDPAVGVVQNVFPRFG